MQPPRASGIPADGVVKVLSVGQSGEDHVFLQTVFQQSEWALCPGSRWRLIAIPTVTSARAALRHSRIPIVLCQCNLRTGVWQELLEQAECLPDPPCLILTFRLGDDRLWAEALNRGAYDVLAQPYDGEEVVRILSMAWLHWNDPRKSEARSSAPLTMASGM